MNVSFIKLRVADDPWILVIRPSMDVNPDKAESPAGPDWAQVAAGLCHRTRGAAASGLVLVDAKVEPVVVQAWDASGRSCPPPPAALLCAARWLFDSGRASGDLVEMTGDGPVKVLVVDSRTFGVELGAVGGPSDVARLEAAIEAPGPRDRPAAALGLELGGRQAAVLCYDGRLPRRTGAPAVRVPGAPRIEAACVSAHQLRVRRNGVDAVHAAGAALVAAAAIGLADREATVRTRGDGILVQWTDEGSVFAAAEASYCLSGEYWLEEPDTGSDN